MGKKEMQEVYWLRIIACLSVVLIHAVSRVLTDFSVTGDDRVVYRTLQVILLYGTPMFVLLSTIVMTHAYKDHIPKGFLKKRLKYIFIPYLAMAAFYAGDKYYRYHWTFSDFAKEFGYNVIGQWHGYFVLIIFQFYLLHLAFVKYSNRFKPLHVLTISFCISVGYWISLYFYFIDYVSHSSYLTLFFSRVLFVGWLFYYVVAYYCGKNYERFLNILNENWKFLLVGVIGSFTLLQYIYHTGILMRVTSARFDVILYTVLLFFLLFYVFSKVKRVPRWIVSTSGYSYGIYLLHPFVQTFVSRTVFREATELTYLFVQLIAGVFGPIVLIYLISKFPFGKYVVGKMPVRKKDNKEVFKSKVA
ncbi:acyltransferase family protein [Alkalihalobacillus sp. MEB130]|uniref:acyltransferase family protein n=1 Tax=Alkalihalobacillus sp. MEB130 TaxID=2976704 RepID=UPI0028DDA36D|nr:acyltransferase family protein [Alkalihalobacillus sp. MEB130]MDT8860137.1 acyltransferase family protein [Alkalihalobacillus sp. MEB130]